MISCARECSCSGTRPTLKIDTLARLGCIPPSATYMWLVASSITTQFVSLNSDIMYYTVT